SRTAFWGASLLRSLFPFLLSFLLLFAGGCSTLAPTSQPPAPVLSATSDADRATTDPLDNASGQAGQYADSASAAPVSATSAATDPLAHIPPPTGRPETALRHGDLWDRIRAGFTMPP